MTAKTELKYFYDKKRHLVCLPYSIPNLHQMAEDLGIHRCWFDRSSCKPHYDIPLKMRKEVAEKAHFVSQKEILNIIKTGKRLDDRELAALRTFLLFPVATTSQVMEKMPKCPKSEHGERGFRMNTGKLLRRLQRGGLVEIDYDCDNRIVNHWKLTESGRELVMRL